MKEHSYIISMQAFLCLFILTVHTHTGHTTKPGDEGLHLYAEWAASRDALHLPAYVRETVTRLLNNKINFAATKEITWRKQPVGLFVTAMKKNRVRACVGTFNPTSKTLSQEIERQCKRLIAADPRKPPLSLSELEDLIFVVSFTGQSRPIDDPYEIDMRRQGLLAEWEGREAVLLPGEAKTTSWGIGYLNEQIGTPKGRVPHYAVFSAIVLKEIRNSQRVKE